MSADTHIFFTGCHWLYIQGVRRAIRERLIAAYGGDWWERGVLLALSEPARKRLQDDAERAADSEPESLLDAGHFGWIVAKHHNAAFTDAFTDSRRAFRDFGRLASARNQWAHIQSISPAQARQAADLMRQMLAALRCEEALEVAEMVQNTTYEPGDAIEEWRTTAADPAADFDGSEPENALWKLWQQAQSYLVVDKSVVYWSEIRGRSEQAQITLTVHNNAPNSNDWPAIHFKSVTVAIPGIGRPRRLEMLGPGETQEVSFDFPEKQLLIASEFVIRGEVDADRLFRFRSTSNLQENFLDDLRQEFLDRLQRIQVNELISTSLEAVSSLNANATLSDVVQIRESFGQISNEINKKRELFNALTGEFHIVSESPLGMRMRELIQALVAFNSKVSELDTAIANTDLDRISEAVSDLKQIQISVLRVEDTIRAVTDNG